MERAFIGQEEEERGETHLQSHCLKLCVKPFSLLGFWVPKILCNSLRKARFFSSCRRCCICGCNSWYETRVFEFYNGNVLNNSVFFDSHCFLEEEEEEEEEGNRKGVMECLGESKEGFKEKREEGFCENVNEISEVGTFGDLIPEKGRESSSSSEFSTSEATGNEEQSHCSSSEESSSPTTLGWPVAKSEAQDCSSCSGKEVGEKTRSDDRKLEKQGSEISEVELMKERFSKLLLGEDMSGCGNGVSTALAISNAITNLCATIFGQLWRLEPLPREKKLMWRREMEWLLCVSDHIVELIPSWQTFPDGSKLEVMTCRPRADLYVNLPALRKLDNMLLEILDGFESTEFWYVDQGIMAPDGDGSSSFRRTLQRQEEKWWLPVPRVPPGGLHEDTRKRLQHKRDCTNQILKAAMAINSISLADMGVPESYMESLPKNGKACLGDIIYRYISSEQFYPECLLDCLDLSSEHQAIEIANRVEASIYMWRRKFNSKPTSNTSRYSSRSSWEMVKELMVDAEKRELLAERAESLLLCLKQRFPGLPQSALDMSKIQYNKDVGKSILESYSRVLESLAFNIVARIDDLFHVDDLTKHTDQFSPIPRVGLLAPSSASITYSVPIPSTPYKTAFTTPSFSPARLMSPAKGDRSPFITSGKIPQRGLGVKKVLTDYLNIDSKGNAYDSSPNGKADSITNTAHEVPMSQTGEEALGCRKTTNPSTEEPLEKDDN